jgi:hypothetical protein
VGRIADHRVALAQLSDWADYLNANSGLPGPRGNLELVAACGEEADITRARALVDTDDEFSTVCGLVALGRLFGEGNKGQTELFHRYASDPRWRVREGVAMALQRAADDDPEASFDLAAQWAEDPDPLVRRAAVAAVAEPRLIRDPARAHQALQLLDLVTAGFHRIPTVQRPTSSVRTLRQALGYAWSVVIVAQPEEGLPLFQGLETSADPDIEWIVRENHKKSRLKRLLGDQGGASPSPSGIT